MYLCSENNAPSRGPEILSIGGGKGGVGKSCFAVNTAITVARKGWRVVLVDADLSCSNVEIILGTRVSRRLDDFFHQSGIKSIQGVLCDTPYENLRLVPGTTGLLDVANPKYQQKAVLIRELRQLDADLVIIDLDAGAHLNTLDFFLMTDHNGVLVVTPEKTSIDNAFKFLRAALYRRIERFYRSPEVAELLKRNETLDNFIETVLESGAFEEDMRKRICGELVALAQSIQPRIVVNKAHNAYEAQIASNILAKYARQHLKITPQFLGYIPFDKHVSEAVNSGMPFVVSQPKSKLSTCIDEIASRLGYV